MSAWLHIIGVTEQGLEALPPAQRALLDSAETILGPQRLLPDSAGTQNVMAWQTPLSAMIEQVLAARGSQTIVLATGDPNWFGIGVTLGRHLDADEFTLHPAASAFQLAAAKLHWPLQNVTTLSLHGRKPAHLQPHILPGNRILALTSDAGTLREVRDMLNARCYGQSRLTVLENLGADAEKRTDLIANEPLPEIGDFYTLAIECVADPAAPFLPMVPGLPDESFVSDGQLTKRDVRATTLAKLGPYPGALLWDVGAGCGSVGIEWMRAARGAKAICFERAPERLAMIDTNRMALGVPDLEIRAGDALEGMMDQPVPDAVFIGGDVANQALFEACWQALRPGGRMVANAVTIEGERALFDRQAQYGGELTRIEIAVLDNVGQYRAFKPRMAVTQWLAIKEETA
ncbi:precorrin-6y C5,15-methyltransferase (decarboxylating) subunit CbiE [Mariluticola halotolerans]|uniref:precorrin-6y C5,15-methyltransferase (decarboxylating) subunit CbiE n=1 Tax=Mariluticola halotolerans TaxID=2909283 RepID=UPI0026E3FF68|nr:precorrin-6y C5,15-methyltransferase (decarboxylating) subunit CbiE [Mariluticola halotolerans]UJQ93203.1 precorrin-6y C5,15-methyltransferase (decarboxylating) subunit CbiE [Mariluticola halotolerans]